MSNQINDITKLIKEDPFNKLWESNYKANLKRRVFDKKFVKGIHQVEVAVKNKKFSQPVFLVNPGPSLDKNIEELVALKKEFPEIVVITSEVCMFKLIDNGISPDIVCSIDPSGDLFRFIVGYDTSNIILVASTCSPGNFLDYWKGPIVFYNQTDRYEWRRKFFDKLTKKTSAFGFLMNLTFVGGTMVQIANILNATEIFLVGWDFSSDDSGKTYCDGFMEKRVYTDLKLKEEVLEDSNFKKPEYKEIRKELLEGDWDKGIEMFLKLLIKQENEKYNSMKGKDLQSNKNLVFYKNIFINVILRDLKRTIYNCTEGGILKEIPEFPLKEARDYMSFNEGQETLRKTIFPGA